MNSGLKMRPPLRGKSSMGVRRLETKSLCTVIQWHSKYQKSATINTLLIFEQKSEKRIWTALLSQLKQLLFENLAKPQKKSRNSNHVLVGNKAKQRHRKTHKYPTFPPSLFNLHPPATPHGKRQKSITPTASEPSIAFLPAEKENFGKRIKQKEMLESFLLRCLRTSASGSWALLGKTKSAPK